MIIIKPKDGAKVFDPQHNDFLPDEGRQFSALNSYWIRRKNEGGIVVAKVEETKATKTTTTKKATKKKSLEVQSEDVTETEKEN